ncbi:MAG: glycosyltransferase family 2 protein [Paludibacteraceae bacterium]|nr:glycosyltransferase family 2 protein [Paludibacteraceae bacterium]
MIQILLSTYNGERYLREQIDSIIGQTYTDWRLLVRDDGSTDGTLALIQEYMAQDSRIFFLSDEQTHKGAMRSFEYLLTNCPAADYYAFADQDDVWLSDKLERSVEAMHETERQAGVDKPLLVHTDLLLTDSKGTMIADSFWKYCNIRPILLSQRVEYQAICNCITGSTMLFNHAARIISLPFPQGAYMHDATIGLSVRIYGLVVSLPVSTVRYRQHSGNALGAVPYRCSLKDIPFKWHLAVLSYRNGYGRVWHHLLHFVYWKIRYFFALHR